MGPYFDAMCINVQDPDKKLCESTNLLELHYSGASFGFGNGALKGPKWRTKSLCSLLAFLSARSGVTQLMQLSPLQAHPGSQVQVQV